jgi:hypothetical protein
MEENIAIYTEEQKDYFVKEALSKSGYVFFENCIKEHVDQLITSRILNFLKGHPKIDALCSVQSGPVIEDCKE